MTTPFCTGIEVLVEDRRDILEGRRIGLITHAASLAGSGQWSAELLWEDPEINLVCLMGPEHGVFGQGGAGERVPTLRHPTWDIPIYSLYGDHRTPSIEMMAEVDTVVVDMQDVGVRCYTYISTLFLVMQKAAACGKQVVVADRPIPLPDVFDGPMLDPAHESFVACLPVPMVYGMTQGETALYLDNLHDWDLDLQVVSMSNYKSSPYRGAGWPPWVPPSPGIRSWETAWCYPATVFTEALPALDCGRGGPLPFQVLGAPWMSGHEILSALADTDLPGVRIYPHPYSLPLKGGDGVLAEGIRLTVTNPALFKPVTTGLILLETIHRLYGTAVLWDQPEARPEFFDQLFGTDSVRRGLMDGVAVHAQAEAWRRDCEPFLHRRVSCLLYP